MLSLPIGSLLEPRRLVVAPPEASAADAAVLMKDGNVGAVLVVEDGRLVGIFTERDAVYRVMAAGRDPRRTTLAEVMTRDPVTLETNDKIAFALHKMNVGGYRHIPILFQGKLAHASYVSAPVATWPDSPAAEAIGPSPR